MEFTHIQTAANLPADWNDLAENYFQQTEFILHTEKHNPCQQRYYVCISNGKLMAAAIVYSLRLDLLTFIKIKSPLKMNIVGIPCSVSCQGIFGEKSALSALKEHVFKVEKGFVLFLNLEENPQNYSIATGKTLPTIVLKNNFKNWDNYLASLRSNYRRRIMLINKNNKELKFEKKACSEFTDEMYQQYTEVYNRSSGKLEKLKIDFFINLPTEFKLTVCLKNEIIIGWNIAIESQNIYYFFLGGINYTQNKTHNTYLRLLSNLVKDGIDRKSNYIELGQTAETPKMRMGGKPLVRYMEARHSNWIINKIIKTSSSLLEYNRKLEKTNAMKEEIV